eukprot:845041-Pyramimonas_sp.AAC.1
MVSQKSSPAEALGQLAVDGVNLNMRRGYVAWHAATLEVIGVQKYRERCTGECSKVGLGRCASITAKLTPST